MHWPAAPEEEYARLPANVQAALPAVLVALVTVRQGEDEAIVAQPVLSEIFAASPEQNKLVEAFIRARLFVSDRTGGSRRHSCAGPRTLLAAGRA